MIKNILISILIGVIAWLVNSLVNDQPLQVPNSIPEMTTLALMILAAMAGSLLPKVSSRPDHDEDADYETGTVKWFNVKKGYGFITRDQGDDVFVHFRNIEGKGRRSIAEGQRVSFIVVNGDKGLQADEVTTIE